MTGAWRRNATLPVHATHDAIPSTPNAPRVTDAASAMAAAVNAEAKTQSTARGSSFRIFAINDCAMLTLAR